MKDITIILDNGHGTPVLKGEIVSMISKKLDERCIVNKVLVPEKEDISLTTRCRRANSLIKEGKTEEYLLISIHVNALGMGDSWNGAHGWECHVCKNAETILNKSSLDSVVRNNGKPIKSDFYIIRASNCPAVLTENLFMTNKTEAEWLLSDEGKEKITEIHMRSIWTTSPVDFPPSVTILSCPTPLPP